ncbi:MAG: ferrous iron transport protein B [Vicinamibacterales bacterium]|nr:ferrous iron transport protein B [Vicinamibacterales bacterium]
MSSQQKSCHASGEGAATTEAGSIALVGHPNVGKSVLFKRLTGRYVMVSNFPGTTVDMTRGVARALPGVAVVDTPGVVSIPASSEDEEVTTRVLLNEPVGTILQVGDAKNLRRTLVLTTQLAEFGLPMVLALNMMDEAERAGLAVDCELIAARLGIPVESTVATNGDGVDALVAATELAPEPTLRLDYPQPVEDALVLISPLLPSTESGARDGARGTGLLWLSGDTTTEAWVAEHVVGAPLVRLREIREETAAQFNKPVSTVIQNARLAFADTLADEALTSTGRGSRGLAWLTRMTTHRVWGWPILAAVLYALYWFVGVFGAGRLVGLIENDLFGKVLNPWLTDVVTQLIPVQFISDLLVGEYGLWTVGITYAIALVLPIVFTFFLAFSLLEDSGYLSRMTVVSNRVFNAIGLNGKAVLPMVLGLGCVTMATLTTRILESKRDRLLAILLLALAVPCSAQLGVVLGLLGSISFVATLIWGSIVFLVLITVGWLAARLIPGERSTLLVEMPPLRMPVISNVMTKTLTRLEWYLKEVVPLFLLGTAFLFVLDKSGALSWLIDAGKPLVVGWLGLPTAASASFIVGFLRRDFGATGLFVLHQQGLLTPAQVVVSMVTITLFIPCVASVLMIARERGTRTAVAMTAIVFPVAFLVGGIVHQVLVLTRWGGAA